MKRDKRPYGVRKQDWDAIKQFEYEKQRNPCILTGKPVFISLPCRCNKWPFAHYHGENK